MVKNAVITVYKVIQTFPNGGEGYRVYETHEEAKAYLNAFSKRKKGTDNIFIAQTQGFICPRCHKAHELEYDVNDICYFCDQSDHDEFIESQDSLDNEDMRD
jgi:hypothetical protein